MLMTIEPQDLLKELILALDYAGLDRVFIMDTLGDYLGDAVKKGRLADAQAERITLGMARFQQEIQTGSSPFSKQKPLK